MTILNEVIFFHIVYFIHSIYCRHRRHRHKYKLFYYSWSRIDRYFIFSVLLCQHITTLRVIKCVRCCCCNLYVKIYGIIFVQWNYRTKTTTNKRTNIISDKLIKLLNWSERVRSEIPIGVKRLSFIWHRVIYPTLPRHRYHQPDPYPIKD